MRPLIAKVKPVSGFSHVFHLLLQVLLPALLFILVRLDFIQLALAIVVLSKWRMVAVRPRFWAANVRANAVDLMVGISIVLFMTNGAGSTTWQLVWAVLYGVWLIVIKPGESAFKVSLQAFIGQLLALMALYLVWSDGPLAGLVFVTGLICYLAARHFFESFDEPYSKLLSYLWGYFGAALAWLLGHWLIMYATLIAQPTLLLTTLGYGLAGLYYLDHNDRLGTVARRQFLFIMIAIVVVVLVFSNWGNKVV